MMMFQQANTQNQENKEQSYQLEIVFFDYKSDFEEQNRPLFEGLEFNDGQRKITFDFRTQSILECPEFLTLEKNVCWVSPANAFGQMNGGIDYYLDEMVLQDISLIVQKRIEEIGQTSKTGKKYLPVGSSVIVQHPNSKQFLISAPTMLFPSDVSSTKNAQHAFNSILALIDHYNLNLKEETNGTKNNKIKKLMCCGLATGVGGMEFPELARQLKDGFDDFVSVVSSGGSQSFVGVFTPEHDAHLRDDLTAYQPGTLTNHKNFGVELQKDNDNNNGDDDDDELIEIKQEDLESDFEELEFSEKDLQILTHMDLGALGYNDISEIPIDVLTYILDQVKKEK